MHTNTDARQTDSDRYGEEVLNASWLPQEMLAPELHPTQQGYGAAGSMGTDVEGFMHLIYSSQE